MPFGNESAWDKCGYYQSNYTHWSHQCLSAMSPLGTFALIEQNIVKPKSPMPFGNESAWDSARL